MLFFPDRPPAPPCPVKFMLMRSEAHFTGVAPEDGTGVENRCDFSPLKLLNYLIVAGYLLIYGRPVVLTVL